MIKCNKRVDCILLMPTANVARFGENIAQSKMPSLCNICSIFSASLSPVTLKSNIFRFGLKRLVRFNSSLKLTNNFTAYLSLVCNINQSRHNSRLSIVWAPSIKNRWSFRCRCWNRPGQEKLFSPVMNSLVKFRHILVELRSSRSFSLGFFINLELCRSQFQLSCIAVDAFNCWTSLKVLFIVEELGHL